MVSVENNTFLKQQRVSSNQQHAATQGKASVGLGSNTNHLKDRGSKFVFVNTNLICSECVRKQHPLLTKLWTLNCPRQPLVRQHRRGGGAFGISSVTDKLLCFRQPHSVTLAESIRHCDSCSDGDRYASLTACERLNLQGTVPTHLITITLGCILKAFLCSIPLSHAHSPCSRLSSGRFRLYSHFSQHLSASHRFASLRIASHHHASKRPISNRLDSVHRLE